MLSCLSFIEELQMYMHEARVGGGHMGVYPSAHSCACIKD